MSSILEFQCVLCSRRYSPASKRYTCEDCGEVGTLDIEYDWDSLGERIDRDRLPHQPHAESMWRYQQLLPLTQDAPLPRLRVGRTPIYPSETLAQSLGTAQVWVKDDGQNPTASLKDRASAVVVSHALEAGFATVSTASTGNAAAALAGISASFPGHLRTVIFVPQNAPIAKITQLQVYGADVLLVKGSYDEAFDLCLALSEREGWHCRNTGINPFTSEGKKTAAYEISEDLGWLAPSAVVVSVGDGSIIGSLYKGFHELVALGWLSEIPRLIGVQAEGSAALYEAWRKGESAETMAAVKSSTVADSISADMPRDRAKALRAVRQSGGAFLTVADEQILAAIPALAQQTGIFAEPAAAAAFAGAQQAVSQGLLTAEDEIVILITGNGLKDIPAAQKSANRIGNPPLHIPTNLEEAMSALRSMG